MPRWAATALGVITALPIAYAAVFIAHVLSLQPRVQPPPFPLGNGIDWHVVAMVLTTVLFVFYVVATFTLQAVPRNKRTLWVLALFIGSILAFPFFWYLYVWRRIEQNDAQAL